MEQLVNRYTEKYNKIQIPQNPKLQFLVSKPHSNGPLVNNIDGVQYKQLQINRTKINISVDKESFFLTKCGEVAKCLNLVHCQNYVILIGKIFESKSIFYTNPVDSTLFNICIVNHLSENLKYWKDFEIENKIMLITHNNLLIAMPLINS